MEDSDAITRGLLIEATQRLLATGGVAALTSRAIASMAEANLASITYYFGSKEQLITESMLATARDLLAPVIEMLGSNADAPAKMIESIVLLRRILSDHRDDLSAYLQIIATAPTSPSISAALQSLLRDLAKLLTDQIAAQKINSELPSWVAPNDMAQLIIAVVHGTIVASVVDPDHTDEAAIGAQFGQLLLTARAT